MPRRTRFSPAVGLRIFSEVFMFCPIDSVYPVQYEQRLTLKNGKEVFSLRPIVQTDEALILDCSTSSPPTPSICGFCGP